MVLALLWLPALVSCASVSGRVVSGSRAAATEGELPQQQAKSDSPAGSEPPAATQATADAAEQAAMRADADSDIRRVSHEAVEQSGAPQNRTAARLLGRAGLLSAKDESAPGLPKAAGVQRISLEDLEQLALENNPTLAQLAATVDKARGVHRQVGLLPNPTVGYFGEEIGDDGTAGKQGGFLSQTIVTGKKLRWNRAVAARDVDRMLWELEVQRQRVLTDVRMRFYDLLGTRRRVEIAKRLVSIAEEGVKAANDLYQAQQVGLPDVLQAEVQLSEVRILLRNAEYDAEAARRRLAAIVGRPSLPMSAVAGTLEQKVDERDWQRTYDALLASSPQLQAVYAKIERARAQIRRQEQQPLPNILTQVAVSHNNVNGDELANVQVGVPLPLLNRNQGGIEVAVGEYRRALSEAERLELSLRDRLAETFARYRQALNQVRQYRTTIQPKARENLELTQEGYRQLEFDLLRVLTAQRTLFEADLAYIRALTELRKADALIGGLLLSGGLNEVPDLDTGALGGLGQRGQALGGE